MIFYFIVLFIISFLGLSILFARHIKVIRGLSDEEQKEIVNSEPDFSSDFKFAFFIPLQRWVNNVLIPGFWNAVEQLFKHFGFWLSKLEKRVKNITDYLHGRNVALNNGGEPSEHIKELNEWKKNGFQNGQNLALPQKEVKELDEKIEEELQ